MAGYLNFGDKDLPFVVTNHHGNPHILFWLERDSDPFGNGESFNVMLALSKKDKQNDLLLSAATSTMNPLKRMNASKLNPKSDAALEPKAGLQPSRPKR